MRELIGCFSHKELKEGLLGRELPGSSVKADKRAREKIIKAASRSKKTQKSISGLVFKHAMDRLFFPELRKPRAECRIFDGYVIGMDFSGWQKSERMYIKLLAPAIQVKIYVQDLNAEHRCMYVPTDRKTFGRWGTAISISPLGNSRAPTFVIGMKVTLKVLDHATYARDSTKDRWIFDVRPARENQGIDDDDDDDDDDDARYDNDDDDDEGLAMKALLKCPSVSCPEAVASPFPPPALSLGSEWRERRDGEEKDDEEEEDDDDEEAFAALMTSLQSHRISPAAGSLRVPTR